MTSDSRRILIIEDDRAIARVLQRNLERAGLGAVAAHDGRSALSALQRDQFDFVLCDFQLPDMTGEDVCRQIRASAIHGGVPIALCTAKAHEIDVAGLVVELGLTQVFFKPFSVREITASICKAVDEVGIASAGSAAG